MEETERDYFELRIDDEVLLARLKSILEFAPFHFENLSHVILSALYSFCTFKEKERVRRESRGP